MIDRRAIAGMEGFYEVDAVGRVFTVRRVVPKSNGTTMTVPAVERKPVTGPTGYQTVGLCRGGKTDTRYVHRMVAEAFVQGKADGLEVNHKNGVKTDNRAENLEWVSRSENNEHKYRFLRQRHPMQGVRGARCKYSMPIEGYDPATGSVVVTFAAMKDAHRSGDYKAPAISRRIKDGRTHRGLLWRLASSTTSASSSA